MKKFLFPALALGLVMTSCQSDEPFAPGMGEEVQATFTISVPDAMGTRAGEVNSALGGFSNGAGNLNYTVALLRAEDNVVMWSSKTPASVNGNSATFNPTVVQGYTYKIVAYATFDSAIDAPTVGSEIPADSGLGAISTLEGINNESEDAYFCNTTILGASSMEATLKRPFGKLRLVAEDYDKLHDLGLEVANVKVTYGGAVVMNTQFNASTKAFKGTATSKVFEFAGETSYSEEANKDTNGVYTVFTDYLPASETGETMYPFEIKVTYKNGKGTYTRTFSQDIPVKRNYLTTLRGNFFTTEAALTLKVEEMFANAINVNKWDGETVTPVVEKNGTYAVSTAAELAWIAGVVNGTITRAEGDDFAGKTIVMMGDIDLDNHQWTPIGTEENPFKGTFEAYGNTIKNLNIVEKEAKEGKAFIGFFGYAKDATIKNVTFENVNLNIACLDIDHSQGHIGAVAGSLEGTSTIENVTVKGNIKVESTVTANGASRVAVVAGGNSYGNVTMKNVHVVANEGSYLKANNNVGALAGQLQGKSVFVNCTSNIDVTGTKFFAGGLIGLAAGDQLFKNCHTTGNVAITAGREGRNHDQYRVGGIAGGWADGATKVCELVNCSYTGNVSGKNSDGSVANPLDYMGYVGRGYTLANCEGSKVIIDGIEFVQVGDSAPYGNYTVTKDGKEIIVAASKEDFGKTNDKYNTIFNKDTFLFGNITLSAAETNANSGYGATGVQVNGAVLDGQGYTLTVNNAWSTWDCVLNTNGGTIKNLTVNGAMRGIFMGGANADVYIDNVKFNNVIYTFNSDGGNKNYGVYLNDCIINGWTSHSDVHKEVVYTNCSFGEGNGYKFCRPYGPTSFVGCDFCEGFEIDAIGAVSFENCTLNGVAITTENVGTLAPKTANVTVK